MSKVKLMARPAVQFEHLCNNFLRYCKTNQYDVVVVGGGFIYQNGGEILFQYEDKSLTIVGDESQIHSLVDEIGGTIHVLKYFDVMYDIDSCMEPRVGDDYEMLIYDLPRLKTEFANAKYQVKDINITRSYGYKIITDNRAEQERIQADIDKYEERITTSRFSTLSSCRATEPVDQIARIKEVLK